MQQQLSLEKEQAQEQARLARERADQLQVQVNRLRLAHGKQLPTVQPAMAQSGLLSPALAQSVPISIIYLSNVVSHSLLKSLTSAGGVMQL